MSTYILCFVFKTREERRERERGEREKKIKERVYDQELEKNFFFDVIV